MKNNIMAIKRYVKKHGWDDISRRMIDENIERRVHKQKPRVIKSLIDGSHIHYDRDDYDTTFCEYWLEDLQGWTDDDIKDYIDDMWERICSPYDCTGKRFTVHIHYHRNPCGLVSFVHYFGFDV